MHKLVILLAKAEDKSEAESRVDDFLEGYGDGRVWDWYQIGGRWNGILAPKYKEFEKVADDILNLKSVGYITDKDVKLNQSKIQAEWEKLGMIGENPYSDHYSLSDDGKHYDILKLKDCVERVKEYIKDAEKEAEEAWDNMIKEHKKDSTMDAYYASIYSEIKYGNFSFETGVFDTETSYAEKLPEELDGYYAVVVDMHN